MSETYFDEINSLPFVYIENVCEPTENEFLFIIKEASADEETQEISVFDKKLMGNPINIAQNSRIFVIHFRDYITYSVGNESNALPDDVAEPYSGHINIFKKSLFFDYVQKSYFSIDKYNHYGFMSENHVINVASCSEPKITKLSIKDMQSGKDLATLTNTKFSSRSQSLLYTTLPEEQA